MKRISLVIFVLLLFSLSACSSSSNLDGQYSANGKPRYDVKIDSSTKLVTIRVTQSDGSDSFPVLGFTENNGKLVLNSTDVYNNYLDYVTGAYIQQVNINKIQIILQTTENKNITETYIRLGTNGTVPENGFINSLWKSGLAILVVIVIIAFLSRRRSRNLETPKSNQMSSQKTIEQPHRGATIISQNDTDKIELNLKQATTSGVEDGQLDSLIGKSLGQVSDEIGVGIVVAKKTYTNEEGHPISRTIIDYPSFSHRGKKKVVLQFDDNMLTQYHIKPIRWLPTIDDRGYQLLVDDRNVEHYR